MSARIGVKSWLGGAGALLKQPNLSARFGVRLEPFQATKSVSQDWGKIVFGRCYGHVGATKPFSQNWGKVGVGKCWRSKQPHPSTKIVVKSLLGGAGPILKQPNLSARIGVRLLLGSCRHNLEETKHLSQEWDRVVVGKCGRPVEASKPVGQD